MLSTESNAMPNIAYPRTEDVTFTLPGSWTTTTAFPFFNGRTKAAEYTVGGVYRAFGTASDFRLETQDDASTKLAATLFMEQELTLSSDVALSAPTLYVRDASMTLTLDFKAQTTLLPLFF